VSNFYVYNALMQRVGQIQNDDSVQWLESYQYPGEVKIVAHVTPENLAMLIAGNRIHNSESDTVARISNLDIERTESEEIITVRADLTTELLSDRVVMGTVNAKNVEQGMYTIYNQNVRGMPIAAGSAHGYTETVDTEITWNSVLDALVTLAESSGLGFKVLFDPETGEETLKVYKGVDRADDTSDDYVGYFGTDVGSVEKVTVTSGTTDYKNVAVVAGAGEGAARTVRIVSLGNPTGENRRELYVDARDLQREYQKATPTGQVDANGNPTYNYSTQKYTEPEYLAVLDQRGRDKLAECLITFTITCTIAQNNIFYGVDYDLGDRVPVKLPEYGIFATARISSVTKIYEKDGNTIVAVLSDFEWKEA